MWASNERVLSKMTPKFLTWWEGETEEPSMELQDLELVPIRSTSVLLPLSFRKLAENQIFISWRQLWCFSTAWYDSARFRTAWHGSVPFVFPLQFSTPLEWAGLFTCRYSCAASTAMTPENLLIPRRSITLSLDPLLGYQREDSL